MDSLLRNSAGRAHVLSEIIITWPEFSREMIESQAVERMSFPQRNQTLAQLYSQAGGCVLPRT